MGQNIGLDKEKKVMEKKVCRLGRIKSEKLDLRERIKIKNGIAQSEKLSRNSVQLLEAVFIAIKRRQ